MRSEVFKYRWPLLGIAALLASSAGAATVAWNAQQQSQALAIAMVGGDPGRAPDIIRRYGGAGCHTIPGIPGGWPGGRAAGGYQTPGLRRGCGPQFAGKSDSLDCSAANVFIALGYARYRNLGGGRSRRGDLSLFAINRSWQWCRARGNGLDVGGDGVAVGLGQHRRIGDYIRHGRTDASVVRGATGLK
jgi:hypothetical protein